MYEQIERVHLFACKRFSHVRNKTPNDVVYGELGRYPLFTPATVRFVKYWLKLLRQTDNLLLKGIVQNVINNAKQHGFLYKISFVL